MERYLEDEQYHVRMHEQIYTQSNMEESDRLVWEKRITKVLLKRDVTTELFTVVQPDQGGGSNTVKTT